MKKNKFTIKALVLGAIFIGTVSSCKKDYFDINTDPNYPNNADVEQLLPSAQAAIAHVVGNNFQIVGGLYAQYWTQSPASSQYKIYEQYSPAASDFDFPWQVMYSDALYDLKTINAKASGDGRTQYSAISKILTAYAFQVLTDNFGDIPYSQALQGPEGIISPAYDSQEQVYNGIIATVKEGIALCDEDAAVIPGSDDLIFHGDMTLWRSFGNTLLLKMYMRLSEVNPTLASTGIAELETSGATFLSYEESAKITYFSEGGNTNPLYSAIIELGSTQNLVASATTIDYMTDVNIVDPRMPLVYEPADDGNFVGLQQGLYTASASTLTSYPGRITGGYALGDESVESALAPVILMSASESFFLQSEAAARGWLTTGDAQLLYEAGIEESFTSLGLTSTDVATYVAQPAIAFPSAGTTPDKIKAIITQKWLALCGTEGTESWTEWRRTGYPDFFVVSANTLLGPNVFPQRLLYPATEVTRNGSFPGQKLISDKVWWDVN